jgi:glycerophosphoryl diester phosphodiesterase
MVKIVHQSVDEDLKQYAGIKGLASQLAEKANKKISLKNLTEPFIMAHRGGSNVYPENTLEAFKQIVSNGIRVIEMDVQILSDGSLVVMHDSTVDRTTDGTGNVSDFHASAWKKIKC